MDGLIGQRVDWAEVVSPVQAGPSESAPLSAAQGSTTADLPVGLDQALGGEGESEGLGHQLRGIKIGRAFGVPKLQSWQTAYGPSRM